jgi:hypothetical protein
MAPPTGALARHGQGAGPSPAVVACMFLLVISVLAGATGLRAAEPLAPPGPAPLQAIEGTIVDASDGSPVPQAVVRMVDGDGGTVLSTLSEGDGWFRLDAPAPGTWRLEAQRIGYEPATREVTLEPGETERIEWRLNPQAMVLDPLEVIGDVSARPPRCVPQLLVGRVVDHATGEPIAGAQMELVGSTGRTVHATPAGEDGRFALVTPGPGLYRLRGSGEEHEEAAGIGFPVLAGDTIEVEFALARDRAPEAPMTVTGSARPWEDRWAIQDPERFFARMVGCQNEIPEGARFGEFLDRSAIAEWEGTTHRMAVGAMLAGESNQVWSTSPEGYVLLAGGRCAPGSFIDGVPIRYTPPLPFLNLEELEAVEVYRYPHVPREYWSVDGTQPCGAISFWTRSGTGPAATPGTEGLSTGRLLAGIGATVVVLFAVVF